MIFLIIYGRFSGQLLKVFEKRGREIKTTSFAVRKVIFLVWLHCDGLQIYSARVLTRKPNLIAGDCVDYQNQLAICRAGCKVSKCRGT